MAPISFRGYMVQDRIKDGSVGTVWRVTDAKGRTLALKQISAQNAAQGRKAKQFRKEFDVTKTFDHSAIIKVYDYVKMPPQDFFTMEYFESESLKETMFKYPKRVHKREFWVLRQLAEALEHVHSKGLIHKDLKPENVLVNAEGDIRLIDFSLSQTKWDRWLQFGRRVEGTPLYMAPEQIRGEKCDARTDIYGFGLIAYELLTKRMPFTGKDHQEVMQKHLHHTPAPMRSHVATISGELDAMVLRMLSKKPEQRPQDMASVIRELSRWEKTDTVLRMKQVKVVEKPREIPHPFQQAASTAY
ncbi:MAG TPA: serine/threonine-protein kinase [Planctomycetota bacterium]|nr:serine/threonine-protein kinase [Planctomycetota bacterium]